ncbi:DUF4132 domain-containing protein [Actinoplanes lobatus]|uniref:DUF4132 domain-containing protein n=1 Tax=Actinoplanes lobatus TaxID=113568 RepID=A0A7W7MKF5_9ACTN|nr:DUF4132 domain-containing protein [Actinoplanes lobatus]MBB4753015.1 hypothetical protein [Actinoplanes lobatus]
MENTGTEDSLILPDAWLEHLHPRRGGARVRPFVADPQARTRVDRMLAERQHRVSQVLAAPSTPEAFRAAAAEWLAGAAVPVGAAAVAAIAARDAADEAALADVWISEHGLRFAALAAVEMASLLIIDDRLPLAWRHAPTADPGIRRRPQTAPLDDEPPGPAVLLRVRAALACAPQPEFDQVVAALATFRSGFLFARAACSVLVPRPDWVEEDVTDALNADDRPRCGMLLYAARTPEQAAQLASQFGLPDLDVDRELVLALVDGVGVAVAPTLFYWVDRGFPRYAGRGAEQRVLSVLAALPGDDVMRGLLARSGSRPVRAALLEAAERFPVRALRILAEEDDELLRSHVGRYPDLADQVMPLLGPVAAGRVRAIVEAWGKVAAAPLSAVPPVLADPPWRNRKKAVKPPVVAGLTCADAPALSWLPGERQEWADTYVYYHEEPATDWLAVAESVINGVGRWDDAPSNLFTRGPEEIARQTLPRWRPRTDYSTPRWLRATAARLGTDALPTVLTLARATPADYGPLLMPFTSLEVATLMADWSARLKSVRSLAQRWLARHPAAAARALIPAALGRAGTARRQAERALLLLHDHGHTEQIRAAAAGYGQEAAAGVEALFVADPLMALPGRMPAPPEWAAPGVLPPVRLRDGSGALPVEAVANLLLILMISRSDDPYAGLEPVREAVEPNDLAEFGWALFELWQAAGGVAKDGWVYDAVALTGDDETARRLTPLIMVWPTEGRSAAAVSGLSVLVGIGTDEALMQVHRISQKAKSRPLREAATARIAEVAEALGLSAEQLADRLVPDFGLDADGRLRLDYGPRQFVVGFDEQLRPLVADADGKRLKALPKPGARDDEELAEAAYRRFSALKRDVRKISTEQVKRLEQAMVTGRRWTGAEFRRLFAEHPLMWHIGRRLVWARFAGDGAVVGALRIAEDRSLADVDDEPVDLGDDDVVGIAHPVQLGVGTSRWAEVFADYEIMQPFPQLGRPVYTLTEQEAATGRLERFEGVTVPTTKVIMLDRRGWIRQEAANAGIQRGFDLTAGPGQILSVDLDPGIVGQVGYDAEQKLVAVYLHDGSASRWNLTGEQTLPLAGLDPVLASEVLRDLTDVTT